MTDNFDALDIWLTRLINRFDDTHKSRLNRNITTHLRAQMVQRIHSQTDPDGRRFAPRKRDKPGSTRRGAMFKRAPSLIKTAYSSRHAEVGYSGRTAEVMKVHQFGKTIKPSRDSNATRYPVRQTVGFSNEDKQLIVETIKDFLLDD